MPGNPPRHAPSREPTRPVAKREPRLRLETQAAPEASASEEASPPPAKKRGRLMSTLAMGLTHRLIALAATFAVLVISFVSSFSVYLNQQKQIAETQAQIADTQNQIGQLQDKLQRWLDPAYVRAQARDQLGWVLPGEVGYRVIDANGQLIGGTVGTLATATDQTDQNWYETIWQSLQTADQPAPQPSDTATAPPAVVGPDGVETPR